MIQSKNKSAMSQIFGIILGAIFLVILVFLGIYFIGNRGVPMLESVTECDNSGGYLFEGDRCPMEDGVRQTRLGGFSKDKGKVCCFGSPVDKNGEPIDNAAGPGVTTGNNGGDSTPLRGDNQIKEKCSNKICYSSGQADGATSSNIYELPYLTSPFCYYLNPSPVEVVDIVKTINLEAPKNGAILPTEKITFNSVIALEGGCCVMQLGGINTDDFNYFTGKNPGTEFKRVFANPIGGKCNLGLEFDFATESNVNNIFDYSNWKESSDTKANCENTRKKAMFKIDVMYWEKNVENCEALGLKEGEFSINDNAQDFTGAYSSLIDIKELDKDNIFYPAEEPTSGVGPNPPASSGEYLESQINFKFLTRKNIGSSSVNANSFESFNNNIYSGSDADVCEVYCVDKDNNPCKEVKIIFGYKKFNCEDPTLNYINPDIDFSLNNYDELKFFEGSTTLRYYCIAYSLDGENYYYKDTKSNCAKIYHILPDSSFPFVTNYQNSCDTGIYECENIQNSFVCDNGINIFSNYNGEGVLNYYRSSYCINQITDCYYDTWKKQCFSCETPPFSCKGYASRNTCEKDPCEWVGDDGCFWDEEKEKCSACVKNCNVFESKTMCDKKENICGIEDECFWEENYFLIFHAGGACNSCCSAITEKDCNKQDSKCASGCDWIDETCKLGV